MSEFTYLFNTRRQAYWLDHSTPDPTNDPASPRYLVCLVFENDPGRWPMVGKGECAIPWYWDEATCQRENAKLNLTRDEAFKIVISSMNAALGRRRRA